MGKGEETFLYRRYHTNQWLVAYEEVFITCCGTYDPNKPKMNEKYFYTMDYI